MILCQCVNVYVCVCMCLFNLIVFSEMQIQFSVVFFFFVVDIECEIFSINWSLGFFGSREILLAFFGRRNKGKNLW